MSDQEVNVKFGADTSGLASGTDRAASSVQEAINKMASAFGNMGSQITANTGRAATATTQMAGTMSSALGGLTAAFAAVSVPLMALGAILAGGALFSNSITSVIEEADAVRGLADSLGIAAEEASVLNAELEMLGISNETYIGMANRFTRVLRENEEGIQKLGVQTRDGNGEFRNQRDLMQDAARALEQFRAGTDRNMMASQIFGRNISAVNDLLRMNADTHAQAAALAEEFGMVLGQENLESARAYQMQMNVLRMAIGEFGQVMGEILMPLLKDLAKAVMPALVVAFRVFVAAVQTVVFVVKEWVIAIEGSVKIVGGAMITLSRVVAAALDWRTPVGTAAAVFKQGMADVMAEADKANARLLKNRQEFAVNMAKTLNLSTAAPAEAPPRPAEAGGKSAFDLKDEKGKEAKSRMSDWENELAQLRVKYQMENDLRDMAMADELKYWEGRRAMAGLSADEIKSLERKIADTRIAIARKTLADQKALEAEGVSSREKAALDEIKIAENKAREEQALGKITADEFIKIQEDLETRRYGIVAAAQSERVALAEKDPNNPVEAQKQRDKLLEIERNHQMNMAKIRSDGVVAAFKSARALDSQEISNTEKIGNDTLKVEEEKLRRMLALNQISKEQFLAAQVDMEEQRYRIAEEAQRRRIALMEGDASTSPEALQKEKDKLLEIERAHQLEVEKLYSDTAIHIKGEYDKMLEPLTGAIEKSINGMIAGTTTLEQAIKNLGQNIIAEFVRINVRKAAEWVTGELTLTNLAKTWAAIRTGIASSSAAAASAATIAAKTTEGTAVVGVEAAKAGAGAAASQASIPIVGPGLAAAAFAATIALVLGAKKLFSASQGFDVPAGMNPVTQLHSNEMVLPAEQADVIRGMAQGGGGGQGITINVSSMDAEGVQRFLLKNKSALMKAIGEASRNGTQMGMRPSI